MAQSLGLHELVKDAEKVGLNLLELNLKGKKNRIRHLKGTSWLRNINKLIVCRRFSQIRNLFFKECVT